LLSVRFRLSARLWRPSSVKVAKVGGSLDGSKAWALRGWAPFGTLTRRRRGFRLKPVLKLVRVLGGVAWTPRLLDLLGVRVEDPPLQSLPTSRVDRMGNVRVKLRPFAQGARVTRRRETRATLVAEVRAVMVLFATAATTLHHLATGHSHERPLRSFDDLEIANHEGVVDGDAAKGPEFVVLRSD